MIDLAFMEVCEEPLVMPRMSSLEYQAYLDKQNAGNKTAPTTHVRSRSEISERELHDQIIKYAKDRGYLLFYSAMDRKTSRKIGEFDFSCCLPGGRIVFVECKVAGRKATPSQLSVQAWLKRLNHVAEIISTVEEFDQLCRKQNSTGKEFSQ